MAEKKPFKETAVYPVIFMILVTIVFVGVLAAFQKTTEARVDAHKTFVEQVTILQVFGLVKDVKTAQPAEVALIYAQSIVPVTKPDGSLDYYLGKTAAGDTLGYAYKLYGKGLWSTIGAIAAFSPDRTRLLNLEIVDQVETPGLGARIEEPWFKGQFSNKRVLNAGQPVEFTLTPEGEKGTPDDNHIATITGATISTRAVTDMITDAVRRMRTGGAR
jgi:Na+-transporting NADH:ubiquinone oxidoreductase subunit C